MKEFGQFYLNDFGELDCTAHSELWSRRVDDEYFRLSQYGTYSKMLEDFEVEKIMYVTLDNENITPCIFVSNPEYYGSNITLLANDIDNGIIEMNPEPGDIVFFSYAAIVNFIKRGMFEHYVRGRKALFESAHKKNDIKPKKCS